MYERLGAREGGRCELVDPGVKSSFWEAGAEEVEGVVATSSFQSRRPIIGGYSQSQDENVFMGGAGDISIGGYQDIDVPLNEDGRLSLSEDEPELPQTPVRKRGRPRKGSVSGTPASSRRKMGTPSTGKRGDDEEARPKKLVRRVRALNTFVCIAEFTK